MSYTFRRSVFTIAMTASTTAVAFIANVVSDLMPI